MSQAKILSEKELKRALSILSGQRHEKRNRLALLLTHWAGMRVCEVAALTLGDVIDVTGGIVEEIRLNGDQTKGDRGRVVYLNNKIRKEIRDYIEKRESIDPTKALLVSQKGDRRRIGFSANSLCQLINAIYCDAGIAGASSHSGRRGFITTLANNSINVKVIMELAGHKQMSTTQRYIHVTPEQKRRAVETI